MAWLMNVLAGNSQYICIFISAAAYADSHIYRRHATRYYVTPAISRRYAATI